jgi:zinc transporter ZupT
VLSRGVHPVKQFTLFDSLRVWAAVTGLLLAVWYFGALYLKMDVSQTLPMLIAAIGGFELFLVAQDFWFKRTRNHG